MTIIALILLVACVILYREMSRAKDEASSANQALMQAQVEIRGKEDALQEAKKGQDGANEELERYKSALKRNMKKLHDSILDKFLRTTEPHGIIVDREFEDWWKLWDGFETDYAPDADEDSDSNDNEADDIDFLETVGELRRRLERLPSDCDDYIVRFKTVDGQTWVQPERCWVDDNGDLILDCYGDGYDHDEFTVSNLCDILTNLDNLCDINGYSPNSDVTDETQVYIIDRDDDDTDGNGDDNNVSYYQALDENFKLKHGKQRVDIVMKL